MATIRSASGQTLKFSVQLMLDNAPADISEDVVTAIVKKGAEADADAPVLALANVAERGVDGWALFDISDEDMDIAPGSYTLAIKWARANGETYYPLTEVLVITPRFFD